MINGDFSLVLRSFIPIFQFSEKAPRYLQVLIPLRLILLYPDENSLSLLIAQ